MQIFPEYLETHVKVSIVEKAEDSDPILNFIDESLKNTEIYEI